MAVTPKIQFAETLDRVIARRASAEGTRPHICLRHEDGSERTLTFAQLQEAARSVAAGLAAKGLRKGDTVALMLPTSAEFFTAFLGTLLAGGIPVPIYPPVRTAQIAEYAQRQSAVLRNAETRVLITFREARTVARLLGPGIPTLRLVATAEELAAANGSAPEVSLDPGDTALIQYTSGSTGTPKGVVLTHANLFHNAHAIGYGTQANPNDVVVSWLPLYHDMGLIGCWIFSLCFGLKLVVCSPLAFLRRPERWLRMIHEHRGTLSPAPNFAYELCARKVPERALAELDLSSWRVALNGAEPINPETVAHFIRRFGPCGFRAEAMLPVYGLAECSVALTFPPLGRPPRMDAIQRAEFVRSGHAVPAAADDPAPLRFASVGAPLPGNELRVIDDSGRPAGERVEGRILFRGLSAMSGYYRNREATQAILVDGWYDSGDLGYQANGELYVTGRVKDVIIKAGHNIYPHELESAAAEVTGIRRGCVAAFGITDPVHATERIVVVAETREKKDEAKARLRTELVHRLAKLGHPPDEVMLVKPQAIPKTPSGKIRRAECRRLYLQGTLGKRRAPGWLRCQLAASNKVRRLRQ